MASYVISKLLGLGEGLICTTPPGTTIDELKKWSPRIETYNGVLQVDFSGLILEDSKDLLRDLNRFGWFPTYILDEDGEGQAFDSSTSTALIQGRIGFTVKFEAKYDVVAEELPDFLWHVSPEPKRKKIEKFGLTPRSHGKLSPHPDRVYLTRTEESAVKIAKQMSKLTHEPVYALFRVNTKRAPKFKNEFGYEPYRVDPNSPTFGVYSVTNIPPGDLTFIRELRFLPTMGI